MRTDTQFAAAPSFALPRITPEIPVRLTLPGQLALQAEVALLFTRAGLLHRRDVQSVSSHPLAYAEAALQGWLRRGTGDLRTIRPQLSMEIKPDESGRLAQIQLVNSFSHCGNTYIGEALEDIERRAPGLGAATVNALDMQWVCPFLMPVDFYDFLKHGEWQGEDDESVFIEENCRTLEEEAEMRADIVTRDHIDACYPPWLIALRSDEEPCLLTDVDLRGLTSLPDGLGPVATAVLEVRRTAKPYTDLLWRRGACLDADDENDQRRFFGYSHLLKWRRDDDISERLRDDMYNTAMEVGIDEAVERATFDPSCPERLARWAHCQRQRHRALRALDHLLTLILAGQ